VSFLSQYGHIALISAVLGLIALGFGFNFVLPGLRLGRQHQAAITALQNLKPDIGSQVTDLERIAQEVMGNDRLLHCWKEFTETLHPQTRTNEFGQEEVVRWRATAMAESFFTEQALVDTPLKAEFYKHLPGILTGIGIIGTFSGLILGLIDFEVSTDADQVRRSLASLIQNVGHAFIVSASAIALAMFFIWIEKSVVTRRYREVETLCSLIDSLFDAGAGEEYLARLVQASETSATQAAQIKDSLVTDLKEVLSELTRQQIEAAAHNNQHLSETLVQTFSDSLKDPINRISQAVERVSGNQGDAVSQLLTDVLSSFSSQMQDMFGGQMKGMNEALQQTALTIQGAAGKFDELAANLQSAGRGAADAMAERLEQVIHTAEARQEAMNTRMSEFAEEIRSAVKSSQSETSERMQNLLAEMGEKVAAVVAQLDAQSRNAAEGQQAQQIRLGEQLSGMIGSLQEQGKQAAETHAAQQAEFAMQTEATVTQMAAQVGELSGAVRAASEEMRGAISQLANTTRDSLERMNKGADTLQVASVTFSRTVDGLSDVSDRISGSTNKLSLAASTLNGVTQASMQVINDYRVTRDTFATIVENLKSTVENARKEASLTSQLVSSLGSAASTLSAAQKDAEEYLQGVTEVLAQAHKAFAESVERTLRKGNADFHKELADAVSLLRGAIQDLGDTLDAVVTRR
jgi:methyl-accepting chemotaxis protein